MSPATAAAAAVHAHSGAAPVQGQLALTNRHVLSPAEYGLQIEVMLTDALKFSVRTRGDAVIDIYWGDGQESLAVTVTGEMGTDHTYAHIGPYVVSVVQKSGKFSFCHDGSTEAELIRAFREAPPGWASDASMDSSFEGCARTMSIGAWDATGVTDFTEICLDCKALISFPLVDTSAVTGFNQAWSNCHCLVYFPALDMSSGSDFRGAFSACSSLLDFPLIKLSTTGSIAVDMGLTWEDCRSLRSFPALDASGVVNFRGAWKGCKSLTTFPLLKANRCTSFAEAWKDCSQLADFPAGFFDSWAATPAINCFLDAWSGATLDVTSVVNVLTSIDTSGRRGPATGNEITLTCAGPYTGNAALMAAATSLKGKGWTIRINGTLI